MFVASWEDVLAAQERLRCASPKGGERLWIQKGLLEYFHVTPPAESSSVAQFVFGGYVLFFEGTNLKQRLRDLRLVAAGQHDRNKPDDLHLDLGESDLWVGASVRDVQKGIVQETDPAGEPNDTALVRLRPSRSSEQLTCTSGVTVLTRQEAYADDVFSLLLGPRGEDVSIGSVGSYFDESFWKYRTR